MEEPIPDLIPDDLGPGAAEPRPLAILRTQANSLAAQTGNVVLAKVVPLHPADYPRMPVLQSRFGKSLVINEDRSYGFHLVVPALDDYTYQAFRVSYPVAEVYPVTLSGALVEQEVVVAVDGPRFTEALREIFSLQEFHRVVNSLMSEASALTS